MRVFPRSWDRAEYFWDLIVMVMFAYQLGLGGRLLVYFL